MIAIIYVLSASVVVWWVVEKGMLIGVVFIEIDGRMRDHGRIMES